MDRSEREALAKRLQDEIGPLLEKEKYEGGYDCCGCSTYQMILDHASAIVLDEPYVHPWLRG